MKNIVWERAGQRRIFRFVFETKKLEKKNIAWERPWQGRIVRFVFGRKNEKYSVGDGRARENIQICF